MLEPCTELYATIFASWLGGFQLVPLSPLFGPDAANYRISDSDAKAIVVSSDHRETISPGEAEGLEYVLLTDDEPSEDIERSFEAVADYDPITESRRRTQTGRVPSSTPAGRQVRPREYS